MRCYIEKGKDDMGQMKELKMRLEEICTACKGNGGRGKNCKDCTTNILWNGKWIVVRTISGEEKKAGKL